MASHIKPGSLETTNGYTHDERVERNSEGSSGGGCFAMEFVLRLLAVAATLSAAVVMSKAKQTEMVPAVVNSVPVTVNGRPVLVPVPAKYNYSPAFIYFVVANSVACVYTALSILATFAKRKKSSFLSTFLLAVTDISMVALISSAASAAMAYAYIGLKGNSHTGWHKICNVYDKFCRYVGAALGVSFVGLNAFSLLTLIQLYTLYKHTKGRR
ncbi:hypothetical protein SUGI_0797170 [Cryptomeria japonica]|uniref:CASP-like protein 1U1 n=1 Tax=Cryptomeria japonica TaxID=3369 RepID=UPI00241475ED|nr:CASP-like protein 1U1 [Cryptomeria japonica]GLJ39110.1 hypothetical protein SUGI_0797170 [Cryptomeria japonica]